MTVLLVDNSALQRVSRSERIANRLRALTADGHHLAVCAPSLDEASYSARSHADLLTIRSQLSRGFGYLALSPGVDELVGSIREALFRAGRGRAAGVIDVQVAAIAAHHGALVLHYDDDFEQIAAVFPALKQRWIAARGTVD